MAHITAGSKSINLPFSVWNAGITGVSGSLTKGSTLTISGYDFGSGANTSNCLYDGCDGSGVRTSSDPAVGAWTSVDNDGAGQPQEYISGARDGDNCIKHLFYDASEDSCTNRTMRYYFPNTKKVYFSYWYKHMPDTYFPSGVVTGKDSFTNASSSAKLAWLGYQEEGVHPLSDTNDSVLPSYIGVGWSVVGNNTGTQIPSNETGMQDWWEFGQWVRVSGYYELDETDPANNAGRVSAEFINPNKASNNVIKVEGDMYLDAAQTAPEAFNALAFGSYYRATDSGAGGYVPMSTAGATLDSDVDHRFDDIYISHGDSAPARVEIGDNPDYDLCTERTLCYPANGSWWQDNQVQVKVERGGLDFSSPLYLFVVHDNGYRTMSYDLSTLQG